ncbi:hypothetical protein [Treponema sp. Marseille-Q4523]|uniref:hypothetical protein n=1 Tax=Treponema TaxID=157 RepID=UPI0019614360|nr:hypothetical protein [Treponema sp. Marseille-Q4523]MBM7023947.1 hypothetical protein [Treponema sp. Marseille-Q4523]
MSVVAACYSMHKKMLDSLKAENKISKDAQVSTTHLKDIIKLYGFEKFRAEVEAKNYDIPDFLLKNDEKSMEQ